MQPLSSDGHLALSDLVVYQERTSLFSRPKLGVVTTITFSKPLCGRWKQHETNGTKRPHGPRWKGCPVQS